MLLLFQKAEQLFLKEQLYLNFDLFQVKNCRDTKDQIGLGVTALLLFLYLQKKVLWYKEDWYFSVIDVVEVSEKIGQLKMLAKDRKMRLTNVADTKTLLRIIQAISSQKIEPFRR